MAKKKETARERREREQARRKEQFTAKEKTPKKTHEATVDHGEPAQHSKKERIKSYAKAAGLKSVFVMPDGVQLMTSFGRGNEAIPEKRVQNGRIDSARSDGKEAFSANEVSKKYRICGRTEGVSDNPKYSPTTPREDLIGAKSVLEMRYFGKMFDDNIHIQLIHSIQDVIKNLSVYSNNILYTLENLTRDSNAEMSDFLGTGYLTLKNDYATFCDPDGHGSVEEDVKKKLKKTKPVFDRFVKNPRLSYYGNAFFRKGKAGRSSEPSYVLKDESEIYAILALLSELRQACFHGDPRKTRAVFRLEDLTLPGAAEARAVLDRIYAEKIRDLSSFADNSAKSNFAILFAMQGADTDEKKAALAKQFYLFSVLKVNKNSGYSIRTLRERMIEDSAKGCTEDTYNSVRAKLYSLFDFIIWRYYEEQPDVAETFRAALRTATTEQEKEDIYQEEAKSCYPKLSDKIACLLSKLRLISAKKIDDLKLSDADLAVVQNAVKQVQLGTETTYFTKLIYLLTLFLDGKEINDLLTTLVHAFENIESFLSVLRAEGLDTEFTEDFAFFANSGIVAQELRGVNSFARMTKEPISGKLVMFEDAAYLLGTGGALQEHAEELRQYLNDNVLDKEKLRKLPNGKPDTGFRNFIISNVIESRRFRYLVRYGDPRKLRAFMECRPLVTLVLGEMTDNILIRYYELCVSTSPAGKQTRVETLADKLVSLNFRDFENVNQRANAEQNLEKQKKQAIISLYLNVAYQIVKNLVYINARYTMAYHCMERDTRLLLSDETKLLKQRSWEARLHLPQRMLAERQAALTEAERALAAGPDVFGRSKWFALKHAMGRQKRVYSYLSHNYACLCGENDKQKDAALSLLALYRNKAAHLSVLHAADKYVCELSKADSWFLVYHYLMQRLLADEFRYPDELPGALRELLFRPARYHSACSDLIKVLNFSFAYNLPRYKDLSIDGLFDKNRPGKDNLAKSVAEK